ncbi:MAG: hypothetical protein L6R41_004290 [Letrouitia leprolyta]|nr:MAG: hypothetical protein L6R41_004290 [Letrouitia leprolyta]
MAAKAKQQEEEEAAAAIKGPNRKERRDAAWQAAIVKFRERQPHLFEEYFPPTLTEEEKTALSNKRKLMLRLLVGPEANKDDWIVANC